MFKRIISYILNILLLLSITTLCTMYVIRTFLSSNNLSDMLFKDTSLISATEEYQELPNFINEEELKETYSIIISEYIKYNSGINNSLPSTDNLKEVLNKYCDDYEKYTGKVVDRTIIDKNISNIDEAMKEELTITDNKLNKFFSLMYSNNILILAIVTLFITIILLTIINHSITNMLSNLSSLSFINAIGMYTLGIAIEYTLKDKILSDNITSTITTSLKKILNHISVISILIGIILLTTFIIIKQVSKKYKQKL